MNRRHSALLGCLVLLTAGCSSTQEPAHVEQEAVVVPPPPPAESSAPVAEAKPVETSTAAVEDPIGVKECDDYLQRWRACYATPDLRDATTQAYQVLAEEWRKLAAEGESQRDSLKVACRVMNDAIAGEACSSGPQP